MLGEVVAEAAERFGPTAAFVDAAGQATSYAELHERSDAVAVGLLGRGLRPGDVVGLTLESTVDYVIAYVGAAKAGMVTAGVNPRLAAAERAACLALVEPALVIEAAVEVGEISAPGSVPDLPDDPDRSVAVVFTSGTTGTPKGARFTNRQLAAVTTIDVADRWGDGSTVPMLASTQFAHVGFMTKLPWYLRLGTTTHVLDRWRAADVLDVIERERIPMLGGVAPQLALLLRDPDFDRRDLSCVQQIVMGGGASSPALVAEARERFGAGYSIRYSSTESGGVGTGTAFDASDDEALHTVGRARPGIEVSVRAEDGTVLDDGVVGEVCLRSGATMAGYWGDPVGTAATMHGDWLRTGDLGRIDDAGRLVLAGRSKEMFIRGGYNVYPAEVEAALSEHPAVDRVAVVPRPDDVMGEVGVAVVVPSDPAAPPTLAELKAFATDRIARFKHPEAMVVVDDLPLTPMQKLDRAALTRLVAPGPAPAPSGTTAIRAATPEDFGAIFTIEVEAGKAFADVGYPEVAADGGFTPAELAGPCADHRLWVAETETGVPVGYAYARSLDGRGHLEQVSVLPSHQGAGIGRALVDVVDAWATAHGYAELSLSTFVDVPWNQPLYEHLGFTVVPEEELGAELLAEREVERGHGLAVDRRVFMVRPTKLAG